MSMLGGIIPPVCTPLDADGEIDEAGLERLVRRLLDAGVHGLFALGSSGEAIYLDDGQRRRALEVIVEAVGGAVPVLAGALAGSTARTVQQARWIESLPVDAIVVTPPFYADVSDAETTTHFERVAAASRLPVVAYDIPGNVGRKLAPDVSIDLLRRGVILGLKDTSGDQPGLERILAALADDPSAVIMTGSDRMAAASLAAGARGIVPGLGNVAPDLFVALFDAHRRGDAAAIDRLQGDIDVMAGIFAVGRRHGLARHAAELGALKCLLHRDGVIASPALSVPLTSFPPAATAEVLAIAAGVGR